MAISINYTAPGSSDSKSTLVPNDTTVETFMEDYIDVTAGSVSVTINGSPISDLDQELEDGDTVVLATKKHASGIVA